MYIQRADRPLVPVFVLPGGVAAGIGPFGPSAPLEMLLLLLLL